MTLVIYYLRFREVPTSNLTYFQLKVLFMNNKENISTYTETHEGISYSYVMYLHIHRYIYFTISYLTLIIILYLPTST